MRLRIFKVFFLIIILSFLNISFCSNKLTNDEKEWIKSQESITLSPDPNYAPIEFLDANNKYKGMAADYAKWIENYTGLEIKVEVSKTWSNVLEKMKNKEIDLISALSITEKREKYMIFSIPYISLENVIITSDQINKNITLKDLKNMKVAVMKNYAINDFIETNYPSIEIIQVNSINEGMQKTSIGLTDAFINEIGQISYYLENNNLTNLKISGTVDSVSKIHFGIRDDYEILKSIIDKSILAMSDKQKKEIRNKWIINQQNTNPLINFLEQYIALIILIFISIILINIYLSKKVKQKTQELNETNEKLKLLNKNLEARVEKKTKIIKKTERELIKQEKLASLGALVSGVAHEINNPLGIAITSASFIDKLNNNLNKKIKKGKISKKDFLSKLSKITESIETLNINLKKAADLIKDFKKISVKQSQDEKVIFNVYDYFESIIASLKPKLKKGDYKINLNCDKNLEIYSFPGVFSQVFTNLIFNSIIHGFKEKDSGKINIEIEKKEDILYIKYSDNGVGISEDILNKIYEPFFTTNRKNGGSGLGLAVIYNLINDKLNGKIKCKSKKNQGVTFKIEVNLTK